MGKLIGYARVSTKAQAADGTELEIKRERTNDSVFKRRAAGKDLGGWRQQFSDSQIANARRLLDAGQAPRALHIPMSQVGGTDPKAAPGLPLLAPAVAPANNRT